MFKVTLAACAATAVFLLPRPAVAQARHYSLESVDSLVLHNVTAVPVTLKGKKGVRVTASDEAKRSQGPIHQLARIKDLEFSNGVIDVELAGAPAPDAPEGARGFVGIAFRLQADNETYDAFYLRPTNGRADDQERRNHSAQYISHPAWPWNRLRRETPGKYEAYVDLVPGEWTKVRIDVRGSVARLFVHGQTQPTLIVNDLKTGANAKGGVALWIDTGTVAHFRNLTVNTAPGGP